MGEGCAVEIETFLGPVKWHQADRRVPFEGLFWAQMAHASLVAIIAQKSLNFQGPSFPMALEMDFPASKLLRPAPYKHRYTNS